ncbi:MAG: AMP-binding protein [Lentisphaeria bacterium]|nr:AMP-binding protein [Lentisphaeria bacterium]
MIVTKDMSAAFRPVEDMEAIQKRGLISHLRHCQTASPFYKDQLAAVSITSAATLTDILDQLPFTEKDDIAARNDDFLAVPMPRVADIVVSSGTTGAPTKVFYTDHDLRRLAYNEEKSFIGCGLSAGDRVLLTCTIDRCFIAGLAYYLGAREMGAATIRNGHANMAGHVDIIQRLEPTAIVGVPTFIRKLGQYMLDEGVSPAGTAVTRMVCIGEPTRNRDMALTRVGADVEKLWQARTYSTYASSETVTTFCECEAQAGGHLHPDLGIVEIIGESGGRLPPGQVGEVVVTPLGVEGMPLIRFKTGDISFLLDAPCPCGRRSPRLGPILGRRKHMLKIKGTTVYPQAAFDLLSSIDGVDEYMLEVTSDTDLSDLLTVRVSLKDDQITAQWLREKLQARLRVTPHVDITGRDQLRSLVFLPQYRKPRRFLDKRNH